jgi:hypothetical protein
MEVQAAFCDAQDSLGDGRDRVYNSKQNKSGYLLDSGLVCG